MNRITMITLGVADLHAARTFYEALGWIAEDSPPGVVFFDCGGYKLGLFPLTGLSGELGRPSGKPGQGGMTVAINWPSEAAVDDAFAAAIDAGGAIVRAPGKMDWGGYSSYWADPDGHVWEYAFNPFWPLDDASRVA